MLIVIMLGVVMLSVEAPQCVLNTRILNLGRSFEGEGIGSVKRGEGVCVEP